MNRRALIIRRFGDDEIARTIEGAIIHNSFNKELEELRGELVAIKAGDAKKGVRAVAKSKDWHQMLIDLPNTYGFPEEQPRRGKIRTALLVGWAMMWYGIFMAYDRLSAWNRGGYSK